MDVVESVELEMTSLKSDEQQSYPVITETSQIDWDDKEFL